MRFRDDSERIRLKEYVNKITEGQPFVPGVKTTITMQKETPPFIKTEEAKKYIERVRKIAEEHGFHLRKKTAEDSLTRTIFPDVEKRSLWMEWDRMERMIIVRKSTDISDPLNHV